MIELVKAFEQVNPALGLIKVSRPILGSVPLGQANARTFLFSGTDDDPHLIVFQDGLLAFTFLLSRLVADVMLSYTDDGRIFVEVDRDIVWKLLMRLPQTYIRFWEAMDAYLIRGHPWKAAHEHSAGPVVEISSHFIHFTQFFVMAHEFGHVYEKHAPATTQAEAHAQEYAADKFGLRALWADVQDAPPNIKALVSVAPAILFNGIHCAEKALATLEGRPNSRSTAETNYPPARARLNAANQYLATLFDKETEISALRFIDALDMLFFLLWNASAERFENMRNLGIKPNRRWTVKLNI